MTKPDDEKPLPTNKQIIEGLQKYFLENSDFKTVSHGLANMMLDFSRMIALHRLPQEERLIFLARVQLNIAQLNKFIRDDFKGDGPFTPIDIADL